MTANNRAQPGLPTPPPSEGRLADRTPALDEKEIETTRVLAINMREIADKADKPDGSPLCALALRMGASALDKLLSERVEGRANSAGKPEWQLIETAPQDGTEILYRTKRGFIGTCFWQTAEQAAAHEGGKPEEYDPMWVDDRTGDEALAAFWMPPPTFPGLQGRSSNPTPPKGNGGS